MEKLYFAHPVSSYGTPIETAVMVLIRAALPGYDIESPNQPHHQENYEKWKAESEEGRDVHSAMQYFFKVVQPGCVGTPALPFLDGKMGLGVAGEVVRDADDRKPTWFIKPTREGLTASDVDAFVEDPTGHPIFVVQPFTNDELDVVRREVEGHQSCIKNGGEYCGTMLVVGHQETRLRSFYQYRGATRPYEEAHLVSLPVPDDFYDLLEKK